MFWSWIRKARIWVKKKKRIFFRCVYLLHKKGASNKDLSCRSRATTAKKCTKKRDEFFFCFAFLPLPSSLLKLHIAVIQKFCSHGNVTSHFSFLFQQYFSQCSLLLIAFPNKWMHLKWKLHRCNYRCNYRSQVNYRCSTNTIFLFLSLCLPPSVLLYSLIICPSRCDYCNIIKTICICNVCICH